MSGFEHDRDEDGCGGNAAPYVLGALTEEETEAFRRHLDSCAVCREEVASLQLAADALPAAAEPLRAPAELKTKVMSAVEQDSRPSQERAWARSRPSAGVPARSRRRLLVAPVLVAAVVVIVLVVVAGSSGGGGARVIRAQVLAPRASASLSLSGGRAELEIAGMPQAAPGRVYEVWVKRAGLPQPTDALFTVSSAGDASVGVPGSIDGVREVLVTSEPRGGSRVPTTAPVILARLS